MNRLLSVLVMAALVSMAGCGSDSTTGGGGSSSNDRVLHGQEFTEVFKDDGNGKNYLYTITEFDNSKGEHCTVVTGDSERTIALTCAKATG